ncbi:MAG: hypothetical protein ACRDPO_11305 [Streptosporangiaceae bacterium]
MLAQHEVTFTTRQLHRILDRYSGEGIRKVLHRLVRQGIVQSIRVGGTYTYELNREHLAADPIIQLARLTQRLLQQIENISKTGIYGQNTLPYSAQRPAAR